MAKRQPPPPTDAELAILGVLWNRGPSTVRQVQEVLEQSRPTGYTTVLKLLQIMTEKSLVKRDDRQRTHIYEARLSRDATQQQLVGDLMTRAFGGSARQLVLQALASTPTSPDELADIRTMLDELEQGGTHKEGQA